MAEVNFNDLADNTTQFNPFVETIQSVLDLPEESVTSNTLESIKGMFRGAFTPAMREKAIKQSIEMYKNNNASRGQVENEINAAKQALNNLVKGIKTSKEKTELLDDIISMICELLDDIVKQYHNYDIILPITLDEGAQIPTYAHNTDAAADLYAADTVIVPAHSIGNMIRTGVHIGLPEGWVAYIVPRSSIGAKTPLRLSNSVGVIDAGYRGPLGVLYDNISDSDYTINAGDRIAQLIVMPCYHFQATVAESLDNTERGEGGFGASGI